MRNLVIALCMMLIAVVPAHGQDDPQYRMEIGVGVGAVAYEGDFNSSILKNQQPMASVAWRYNFNPSSALRVEGGYGKLKGSAEGVETYYPTLPDAPTERLVYEFDNRLIDFAVVYEHNFLPYGTGRDYRGAKRFTPYVFGGLGVTSVSGDGNSAFTANVPVGIGVKYKAAERVNVGLSWAVHFSLSDELDGKADPYGIKSSGIFKNTDCYSALQLSLTYSFSAKCRTCNKD